MLGGLYFVSTFMETHMELKDRNNRLEQQVDVDQKVQTRRRASKYHLDALSEDSHPSLNSTNNKKWHVDMLVNSRTDVAESG